MAQLSERSLESLIAELEALRESEERCRSILKNAPGVIATADPEGTVTYANRTFSGIPPERVVGTNVLDHVLPEFRPAAKEVFEEAGLHGRVVPEPLGSYQDAKWGKQLEITVVLFEVSTSDTSWPEAEVRERKWVSAEEARRLLAKTPLERFVRLAEKRLGEEET